MKKYIYGILGILIGFSLSLTITTHADAINTLIGKVIQGEFPVIVDNIKLDKSAIVIDGTSYLPVRAIGAATGYDITFNADLGVVLKKNTTVTKGAISNMSISQPIDQAKLEQDQVDQENVLLNKKYQDINALQNKISVKKESIVSSQNEVSRLTTQLATHVEMQKDMTPLALDSDKVQVDKIKTDIKTNNDSTAKLQLEINNLQSQIDAINATITPTP